MLIKCIDERVIEKGFKENNLFVRKRFTFNKENNNTCEIPDTFGIALLKTYPKEYTEVKQDDVIVPLKSFKKK